MGRVRSSPRFCQWGGFPPHIGFANGKAFLLLSASSMGRLSSFHRLCQWEGFPPPLGFVNGKAFPLPSASQLSNLICESFELAKSIPDRQSKVRLLDCRSLIDLQKFRTFEPNFESSICESFELSNQTSKVPLSTPDRSAKLSNFRTFEPDFESSIVDT